MKISKYYFAIPAIGSILNMVGAELFVRLKYFFLLPSVGFFLFDYHVGLFIGYFIYFMFLSYLVNELHFGMREIFVTGIAYGTFMEFFWTQSLAGMPWENYFINWLVLPFMWWGLIQTCLFYYASCRLASPDEKEHPKLRHAIPILFIAYLMISIGIARAMTEYVFDLDGMFLSLFIIISCTSFLVNKFDEYSPINRNESCPVYSDVILDLICAGIFFTVAISLGIDFFIEEIPVLTCINTYLSPLGTQVASLTYSIASVSMIPVISFKRY
ncbi:MAG: hypothetical protein ACTSQ8_17490 [Candidatus Helarchaeota archaeon]